MTTAKIHFCQCGCFTGDACPKCGATVTQLHILDMRVSLQTAIGLAETVRDSSIVNTERVNNEMDTIRYELRGILERLEAL